MVSKANRSWGFIFRNTKAFRNPNCIRYIYISLIKSVVMYASTIWRPNQKTNIARLERIQHKVLRYLASLSSSPMSRYDHDYSKIAETFDISTILSSMFASDNLFTFKIVSDTIRCPELKIIFPLNNPSYPLSHNHSFYPPVRFTSHSETNAIYRLCTAYNALSHKTLV